MPGPKRFPPIELMRASGSILKDSLNLAESLIAPGVSTREIDSAVKEYIYSKGGTPAFLGYDGFPDCCCISVNDEVVHCLPSARVLVCGDIVSIDCGVVLDGAYTDAARTFGVGSISERLQKLLDVTYTAECVGISKVAVGNRVGSISNSIQSYVELSGFSVSRQFVGHAIGYKLHQTPWIPNYGSKNSGIYIKEGMCLAIEPIVFDGSWKVVEKSRWCIVSSGGVYSAHFEDTVVSTVSGPEVVTR